MYGSLRKDPYVRFATSRGFRKFSGKGANITRNTA